MKLMGKKPQDAPAAEQQQEQANEPTKEKNKAKAKGLQVGKYELSDGKVKFFVAKGFGKKKWVLAREIPVVAIEHVESEGNRLGLTVNGAEEWFYSKEATETFTALKDQLQLNAQPVEEAPTQQETVEPQQENLQPTETPQQTVQPQIEPPQLQTEIQQPVQEAPSQPEPKQVQQQNPPVQEPAAQPEPKVQEQVQQKPEKKPKGKTKSLKVIKFEVSEDIIKFSAAKGFFRKKSVVIREIPVPEVEKIEGGDNKLTLTWKGTSESFYTEEKTVSFKPLIDQINGALDEKQKILERQQAEIEKKKALQKDELLSVIDKSVNIVDQAFNLLIDLQNKRINWVQIETYAGGFGDKLNFKGQTLPPLSLDYTKIGSAAKMQMPREAAKEALDILKVTYGYFDALKPEEDIKENPLNFQTAKTLVSAYIMLNDLLLGRFVGDKNNTREIGELEASLQSLAKVNFKVDAEALKGSIGVEGEKQEIIDECRADFQGAAEAAFGACLRDGREACCAFGRTRSR